MTDPHEIRMIAAQGTMVILDALDDETIALIEPASQSLSDLAQRLNDLGVPQAGIVQFLVGVAVGVVAEKR